MSEPADPGRSGGDALDALRPVLVEPETREPLRRASPAQLEALRAALARGAARRADGEAPPPRFEGAYIAHGGRWVYLVVDGIPCLLREARLELDEAL